MQELEHFVGIDQDASALEIAQQRLKAFQDTAIDFHYIHGNFRYFCHRSVIHKCPEYAWSTSPAVL
jgi:16S rRNA C1402 N4-methylase RsmH